MVHRLGPVWLLLPLLLWVLGPHALQSAAASRASHKPAATPTLRRLRSVNVDNNVTTANATAASNATSASVPSPPAFNMNFTQNATVNSTSAYNVSASTSNSTFAYNVSVPTSNSTLAYNVSAPTLNSTSAYNISASNFTAADNSTKTLNFTSTANSTCALNSTCAFNSTTAYNSTFAYNSTSASNSTLTSPSNATTGGNVTTGGNATTIPTCSGNTTGMCPSRPNVYHCLSGPQSDGYSATPFTTTACTSQCACGKLSPGTRTHGIYQAVGVTSVVGLLMGVVPGTDLIFVAERPTYYHPDGNQKYITGYFNLATNKFTYAPYLTDSPWCGGLAVTSTGNVAVIGGAADHTPLWKNGHRGIRIFDRMTLTFKLVSTLFAHRWYPTVTLLPSGQLLTMGGTIGANGDPNPQYELWSPANATQATTLINVDPTFLAAAGKVFYPFNYVLPSGDLFAFCEKSGNIINPYTGAVKAQVPAYAGTISSQYPYAGTSVMLALWPSSSYAVQVVVFGGQDPKEAKMPSLQASATSQQISVFINKKTGAYTFSAWDAEDMGMARVMGDATLLPNGYVVLLNGAMNGQSGNAMQTATQYYSNANNPSLYAYLFNPTAPKGSRYTRLAATTIARLYHSSAGLSSDGNVVVVGSDSSLGFTSALPVSQPTAANGTAISAEYRAEVFYTPFWYSPVKPTITAHPQAIRYNTAFQVQYSLPANAKVTNASLVAASAATHGFNMNQRVVGLVVSANDAARGIVTLIGPPNGNIAPASVYLLFLLNGHDYSSGVWVTLSA